MVFVVRKLYKLLWLIVLVKQCTGDESCTVDGISGTCVPLDKCAQYLSLLKNSETTLQGVDLTQKRQCGFDGLNAKVCCPEEKSTLLVRTVGEEDDFVDALPPPGVCGYGPDLESVIPSSVPRPYSTYNGKREIGRRVVRQSPGPTSPKKGLIESVQRIYHGRQVQSRPSAGHEAQSPGFEVPARMATESSTVMYQVPTQPYLYNGVEVKNRSMVKWMALLGYKDDGVFWQCGGTIITSRHVLTAAHCIKASLYLVRLGELDLAKNDEVNGPVDFLVKRAIRHEDYTQYHNDIAIVVLKETISFTNTFLAPVCLPPRNPTYELRDKFKTYVTGWGETEKPGYQTTKLLYAYLDLMPRDVCKSAYNRSNLHIDDRVLCAGDPKGKHDACNGDSGGPLIHQYDIPRPPAPVPGNDNIFHIQIGIVSYGFKCTATRFMGVYTNVSHYMPWIEQKVLGRSTVP